MKLFKKKEYFFAVRRPYKLFFASLIFEGFKDFNHYKSFLDKPFAITHSIYVDSNYYYTTKEYVLGGDLAFDNWKDSKNLDKAKKEFIKREKVLIDSTRLGLKEFSEAYEAYMPALILVWACEKPVEERLREELLKKISQKEFDDLMNILNVPLEDNFYKKEEYDLVITNNLQKHVKEYKWIYSRYGSYHPYTLKQAKEKLSKIDKKKFLKRWDQDKEELKKIIKKAKKILESKAYLVDLLQFIVYYRTQRTDIMNKAGYLFIPKLKEIAKERKLTYEEVLNCTKQELLGGLPSRKDLDIRLERGYSASMYNGNVKYYFGNEIDKLIDYMREDEKDVKDLKGASACNGVVQGKVKIILEKDDFSKLDKGDILVTSMTTPDFIPIMKKAAAFVTDEGGITCHAAIISREMSKPCIIGTKIATKVLKDGDLVEVDADNGTVKKL